MKLSTVVLVAALAATSVTGPAGAARRPRAAEPILLGYFTGTLLCADCLGVRTELTLVRKGSGWAEGRYLLKRTFVGKSAKPVVATGEWTTLRGDAVDDNAVVYELDPDAANRPFHFVQDGPTKIRALDAELKALPPRVPAILTLQVHDRPGDAAVACLQHGGVPDGAGVCAKAPPGH